jgi:hypothetical protein
MTIATHIIDITGGTLYTVDSLLEAAADVAAQTGGDIVAAITAELGSTTWRTHPSNSAIVTAINTQLGNTNWQTQPSNSAIVTAINTQLGGTTWQSGGSGSPTFGSLGGAVADNAALVAAFADKANDDHTHLLADLTDLDVSADMVAFDQGIRPGLYDDLDEPPVGTIIESSNDGHLYWVHRDGSVHLLCDSGGYGGGTWGTITGTLSDQTDLQTALNAKQPLDATLTAMAAVATHAGIILFTAPDTCTMQTFASAVQTIATCVDMTAVRSVIGLEIGVHVPAFSSTVLTTGTQTVAGEKTFSDTLALGGGSTTFLAINANVTGQTQILNLRPTDLASANVAGLDLLAGSAATRLPALRLFSAQGGSPRYGFQVGTGSATLAADTWHFASTVVGVVSANSLPLSFTQSNTTDGRFSALGIANSGAVTIAKTLAVTGAVSTGMLTVGVYTFTTVPSASANTGATIRISDRSHRLATSNGTVWNWAGTTTAIS